MEKYIELIIVLKANGIITANVQTIKLILWLGSQNIKPVLIRLILKRLEKRFFSKKNDEIKENSINNKTYLKKSYNIKICLFVVLIVVVFTIFAYILNN